MNTITIPLSSTSTSTSVTLSSIELIDVTEVFLDFSNIFSKTIPLFLIIDYGNGTKITYDNDLYNTPERQNINIFNPNPLFNNTYSQIFYPSSSALYKVYTIQALIKYSNNEFSTFTIPISVISNDYHESIGDITLLNVNILPFDNNPKEYQIKSKINNQLIELRDMD